MCIRDRFDSQPTANADSDQRICEDAGSITMAGVVGDGVTTGTWTTAGDGTFGDPSVLNTVYTPGSGDIAAGSVELTLTSANNGTCASATDAMTLMIDLLPTADAGVDQEVCGATAVTMAGVIGGGGDSLIWTSTGGGTFNDSSLVNAVYTPSASDVGTVVTMTLTVGGVLTTECNGAIDEMTVTFDSQPTANADSDQRICEDAGSITMAGVVGGLSLIHI